MILPVSDPDRDVSPYDVAEGVSGRSVDPLWMRFARKLGVDRAIGFAVAGRLWQVVSGPITQAFLLLYFTDQQRGFYYAFLYLIALQAFVELGFQVVLINLSSHEWSKLTFSDGRLDGDSTAICRLGSLWQKSRTWYLFASLVFTLAVSVFGYEFLGAKESGTPQVNWTVPWMVFVIVHGLHLTLVPAIGILEGCGQIAHLNKYRVWQGVLGSVVVWLLMWQGFGLWSLVGE